MYVMSSMGGQQSSSWEDHCPDDNTEWSEHRGGNAVMGTNMEKFFSQKAYNFNRLAERNNKTYFSPFYN